MHSSSSSNSSFSSRRRSHSMLRTRSSHSAVHTSKPNYKRLSFIGAGILLVAAIIFLFFKLFQFYDNIHIGGGKGGPGTVKVPPKTAYNILLTGYGGEQHEGSYLTDTLMIAHIDLEKNKAVLFSIPRDLWVQMPSTDPEDPHYTKINAVYQAGLFPQMYPNLPKEYKGEENAPKLIKHVVKNVTGLEIDYFVGVDFTGFEKFIDTLGGIEVTVKKSFDDYYYPVTGKENDLCGHEPKPTLTDDQYKERQEKYDKMSDEEKAAYNARPVTELDEDQFQKIATEEPELAFPCRYEHLHFDAGKQTMDGETALKFARSRKSLQDGGDFNRAARQQLVIEAIKDKVLSIGFIPKILPTLETLSDHISTDMPLSQVQDFLKEAPDASSYKISNYVLNQGEELVDAFSDDGQYILEPKEGMDDFSGVQQTVKNVINEITPTPEPTEGPSPTRRPTGTRDN